MLYFSTFAMMLSRPPTIGTPSVRRPHLFGLSSITQHGLAVALTDVFSSVGDVLSQIPVLDVGIPAILSVYFDWFSGIMQAFIFCMLTVMYIANAAEE